MTRTKEDFMNPEKIQRYREWLKELTLTKYERYLLLELCDASEVRPLA